MPLHMKILSYFVLAFWAVILGRTILNLLTAPRLSRRAPSRFPLVSIIVPARDEEHDIEQAVTGLLAQTYPHLEVIVVNDRSVDATGAILERLAHPRLTVITGEEPPSGWLGKPWALEQGSRRAKGELLLFVDADVLYEPEAVERAVATLEEQGVPMIAVLPRIEMHGFWEHIAMPALALMAFSWLPLWLSNRSRWVWLAVGGGTGNLVRREDYDACGGHVALQGAVVDDVGLARLLRRCGRRTVAVRADDAISVRMYHGLRETVDGFTKNGFAVLSRSYTLAVLWIASALVMHLLPYGLALAGDLASAVTVGLITLSRVLVFAFLGYRLDNALFGHPLMMLVWTWIMLRSVWRTGIRRQLHWRGRTYDASRTRFGAD